jgi:hypothetical protein
MGNAHNENLEVSYYAVAFIDLLGQKDVLRELDYLPQNDEEKAKFIATLKKTAGVVDDLNRSMTSFLEAATRRSVDTTIPEPLRDFVLQMTKWEVKHQRFSDGIMLFTSLSSKISPCPVVGVGTLLMVCSSLMLLSLAKGHPIRGGIDVGVGLELYPNELYGPAVGNAYHLENSIAQYPRIVVGDSLVEYLRQGEVKEEKDAVSIFRKKASESCLDFISEDTDGHAILSYLGKGASEVFGNTIDREILEQVTKFVGSQGEKYRQEKNTKLIMRYLLLTQYICSCLPLWFKKDEKHGMTN